MGEYEGKCCQEPAGCCQASCDLICGNNVDFEVTGQDCEIHADLLVKQLAPSVRIWGQIKDCNMRPMGNVLLKLLKIVEKCGKVEYYGVAHTISDCDGFYQFEVAKHQHACRYKILVGKDAKGLDRTIEDYGSCRCCNDVDPCCK